MGLDVVELIMRVEEEFGIVIEDEDAERIETPGALCALIERKLDMAMAEKRSGCPTSRAFYTVRREMMQRGIQRAHIKPATPLTAILPSAQRHSLWGELESAFSIQLPPLERPFLYEGLVVGWVCLSLIGLFASMVADRLVLWGEFFVGGALALMALHFLTVPLRVYPPKNLQTVGDLTRRVAWTDDSVPPQPHDIWLKLQSIVADESGVPLEKVTRDAHIHRDLGMG